MCFCMLPYLSWWDANFMDNWWFFLSFLLRISSAIKSNESETLKGHHSFFRKIYIFPGELRQHSKYTIGVSSQQGRFHKKRDVSSKFLVEQIFSRHIGSKNQFLNFQQSSGIGHEVAKYSDNYKLPHTWQMTVAIRFYSKTHYFNSNLKPSLLQFESTFFVPKCSSFLRYQ